MKTRKNKTMKAIRKRGGSIKQFKKNRNYETVGEKVKDTALLVASLTLLTSIVTVLSIFAPYFMITLASLFLAMMVNGASQSARMIRILERARYIERYNNSIMKDADKLFPSGFYFDKIIKSNLGASDMTDDHVNKVAQLIYLSINKLNEIIGDYNISSSIYQVNNAAYIKSRKNDIQNILKDIQKINIKKTSRGAYLYDANKSNYKKIRLNLRKLLDICEYETRRDEIMKNLFTIYIREKIFEIKNPKSKSKREKMKTIQTNLEKIIPSENFSDFNNRIDDYIHFLDSYFKIEIPKIKKDAALAALKKTAEMSDFVKGLVKTVNKSEIEKLDNKDLEDIDVTITGYINELTDSSFDEATRNNFLEKAIELKYNYAKLNSNVTNSANRDDDVVNITSLINILQNTTQKIAKPSSFMRKFTFSFTNHALEDAKKLAQTKEEIHRFITGEKDKDSDTYKILKETVCSLAFT